MGQKDRESYHQSHNNPISLDRRLLGQEDVRRISDRVSTALSSSLRILYNAPLYDDEYDVTGLGIKPSVRQADAAKIRSLVDHVHDIAEGFALQLNLGTLDTLRVYVERVQAALPDIETVDPFADFFAQLSGAKQTSAHVIQKPHSSESYGLFRIALNRLRSSRSAVSLNSINAHHYGGLPYANVQIPWIGPTHPEAELDVIMRMNAVVAYVSPAEKGNRVCLSQRHSYDLLRTAQILAVELDALSI